MELKLNKLLTDRLDHISQINDLRMEVCDIDLHIKHHLLDNNMVDYLTVNYNRLNKIIMHLS